MKRTLLRIALCWLLTLVPLTSFGAGPHIDIAIPERSPGYLDFARAMQHNLQLLDQPAEIDIVTPAEVAAAEHNGDPARLVITVGDGMLDWAASPANPYRLTLAFYTTSTAWSNHATSIRGSALFRDQPLSRQLALGRLLIPRLRSAVVLIDGENSPPGLWELANASNIEFSILDVAAEPKWPRTLSQLMATHDLLLAHDDDAIYNRSSVRSLLLTAYRHGKFMIGPNRAFVEAGSLASAYTSTDQHLRQLNEMIAAWLRTGHLAPPQFPSEFRVAVNRQVATSLGLRPPSETELANRLRQPEAPQ